MVPTQGVGLLLERSARLGVVVVKEVIKGGAADREGTINKGDRVVAIDHATASGEHGLPWEMRVVPVGCMGGLVFGSTCC